MCVLLPVSSQSPPSGTAVDFIALNDDPAPFSLMHSEKTASPVAMPRSHRSFCSAVPRHKSVPADLLAYHGIFGDTAAEAAVLGRNEWAEVAAPAEFAVQLAREAVGAAGGIELSAVLVAECGELGDGVLDPGGLGRIGLQRRVHQPSLPGRDNDHICRARSISTAWSQAAASAAVRRSVAASARASAGSAARWATLRSATRSRPAAGTFVQAIPMATA